MTNSIKRTIHENNRRRRIQIQHNKKHGITPQTIQKSLEDITDGLRKVDVIPAKRVKQLKTLEESDLVLVLLELKEQMKEHAQKLEFEKAAELRDLIRELEG